MEFEFIADRPVLDFLATIAERGVTKLEKLRTGADLRDWIAQARLVDKPPTISPEELAHAKVVREAMFGVITSMIDNTPPRADHRRLVNATAAHARPTIELSPAAAVRRTGGLDAVSPPSRRLPRPVRQPGPGGAALVCRQRMYTTIHRPLAWAPPPVVRHEGVRRSRQGRRVSPAAARSRSHSAAATEEVAHDHRGIRACP